MIPTYTEGTALVHRGVWYRVGSTSMAENGEQILNVYRILNNTSGVCFSIMASEIDPEPLTTTETAPRISTEAETMRATIAELSDQLGRAKSNVKELRLAARELIACVNNMIAFMGPTQAKKFNRLYGIPKVDITWAGR